MKILVSACLLGENYKYRGGNNYNAAVAEYGGGFLRCPGGTEGRVPEETAGGSAGSAATIRCPITGC